MQPVLMCMLIAIAYSMIIISPISTVATSMAIGISGLEAGAASIGITAAEATLVFGTITVNRLGVPATILLGGVKMMLPNMVKYPVMLVPITVTAAISGFVASFIGIGGTKESAGFGIIGMVGPINAFRFMHVDEVWLKLVLIITAFFVVPFTVAYIAHFIFIKIFKLYDKEIFRFLG